MASWTLLDIVNFISKWSFPLFCLITLVSGILILTGKNKNLKLLGLGAVLGLGNTLANYINTLLPQLYNDGILDEEFYRSGNVTNVKIILGLTAFSFLVVCTVLRWLYTRRAYGTSIGVLITILVLMVLGPAAQIIATWLMAHSVDSSEYIKSSVYVGAVSLVFSIATTVVFMSVFHKNRKTEKAIPYYWVFFLLTVLADIITYLLTVGAVNNMGSDNYALFATTTRILLGFIYPVSCMYLFKRSRFESIPDQKDA